MNSLGIYSTQDPYKSYLGPLSAANRDTTSAEGSVVSGTTESNREARDKVTISPKAEALAARAPKSFQQVTAEARASLDRVYDGKSFDFVHARQEDMDRLMGGLDRRALYAVASNSGGVFSADEQTMARSIMAKQQTAAMGLTGSMGSSSMTLDPTPGFAAGIRFMDSVSAEEKQSMDWKVQRANLQWGYESSFDQHHKGEKREDFTIDDPIILVLLSGMQSADEKGASQLLSGQYVEDIQALRKQPMFSDAALSEKLDNAIASQRNQLSSKGLYQDGTRI
jgi:hypothetical protein